MASTRECREVRERGRRRTFDQLAAVGGARVELQGDDVTLGLIEKLDGDADCGRHDQACLWVAGGKSSG